MTAPGGHHGGIEQPPWVREMLLKHGLAPANPLKRGGTALGEIEAITAEMDAPKSDLVVCPRCQLENSDVVPECPRCGWKFSRECRDCHRLLSPGATRCENCGADATRRSSFGPAPVQSSVESVRESNTSSGPTAKRPKPALPLTTLQSPKRYGLTIVTSLLALVSFALLLLLWPPAGDAVAGIIHVNPHDILAQLASWLNHQLHH